MTKIRSNKKQIDNSDVDFVYHHLSTEEETAFADKNLYRKIILLGMGMGVIGVTFILCFITEVRELKYYIQFFRDEQTVYNSPVFVQDSLKLSRNVSNLRKKAAGLIPSKPYLIIDSSGNRFYLMKGRNEMERSGICSTGSYTILKSDDLRQWIFKTPQGILTVKGKLRSPVWRRPDWAFVEEGRAVPSPTSQQRFEAGVLGEYALYLGDGYFIHGTLYKRLLGLAVTHGCVRFDDEDLRVIYQNLDINSKVFIY